MTALFQEKLNLFQEYFLMARKMTVLFLRKAELISILKTCIFSLPFRHKFLKILLLYTIFYT